MNELQRGPLDNGVYDIRHYAFMRECPHPLERPRRWWPSLAFWQGAAVAVIVLLLMMGAKV